MKTYHHLHVASWRIGNKTMAFDNGESRHAANESQQGTHGRNYFHFCFFFSFSQFLAFGSTVLSIMRPQRILFAVFLICGGRDRDVSNQPILFGVCSTYSHLAIVVLVFTCSHSRLFV